MTEKNIKKCPHCGAVLPEGASFCPHCAQALSEHIRPKIPAVRWRKFLRRGVVFLLLLALVIAGAVWYRSMRPREYDALGEISYTDGDGSYRLMLCNSKRLYESVETYQLNALAGENYRAPILLCVLDADSGEDVGPEFFAKIERVTAEVPTISGGGGTLSCTAPDGHDAFPETVLVSLVDFVVNFDYDSQMVWTIDMKNGDIVRLRLNLSITIVQTYDYYPEDAPMETTADLQALMNQLSVEIPQPAIINLHLPAVTYTDSLVMDGMPINLYVSEDAGRRTTFTDTLKICPQDDKVISCTGIDFVGANDGTGLEASAARVRVEDCTFSRWEIGLLVNGTAWGQAVDCRFTDNSVGFHFDSADGNVSDTMFNDNLFKRNSTAVLLERVPTNITLDFRGSRFAGNGIDIDNRCDQPLDLSEAAFEQRDD